MSRTAALIAASCILQLGICTSQTIAKNISDTTEMPANSESISDTAAAEQPKPASAKTAKSMVSEADDDIAVPPIIPPPPLKGKMELKSAIPKYDDGKGTTDEVAAKDSKPAADDGAAKPKISKSIKSKPKKSDDDEKDAQDDKESANAAYMSHDDSGQKLDPLQYYDSGMRYMKLKKYQLALDSFSKALEINPNFYEASYRKAEVYQLTGYDKYAARRYQDVLKYKPDLDQARINLAELHRKHKHYIGAEEQLLAVIQHNWASFEGHYNLANIYVEDNKMEDALKEYKFCLKMKPNNANLHNNMGVLFLQKNYPDEALQEFRKAAQLAPNNQMFLSNIGAANRQIALKKSKNTSM